MYTQSLCIVKNPIPWIMKSIYSFMSKSSKKGSNVVKKPPKKKSEYIRKAIKHYKMIQDQEVEEKQAQKVEVKVI